LLQHPHIGANCIQNLSQNRIAARFVHHARHTRDPTTFASRTKG
jgi:hypothetical protein